MITIPPGGRNNRKRKVKKNADELENFEKKTVV